MSLIKLPGDPHRWMCPLDITHIEVSDRSVVVGVGHNRYTQQLEDCRDAAFEAQRLAFAVNAEVGAPAFEVEPQEPPF